MDRTNVNAALVFEFCYCFVICKSYFGKIDEELVKQKLWSYMSSLFFTMKDIDVVKTTEINDLGYPQNSEIDALKTYITTKSIVSMLYFSSFFPNFRRGYLSFIWMLLVPDSVYSGNFPILMYVFAIRLAVLCRYVGSPDNGVTNRRFMSKERVTKVWMKHMILKDKDRGERANIKQWKTHRACFPTRKILTKGKEYIWDAWAGWTTLRTLDLKMKGPVWDLTD